MTEEGFTARRTGTDEWIAEPLEVEEPEEETIEIPNTLEVNRSKSEVENPVALVHQIATEMVGARRKDVIAACEARGVAFHTARTQYQVWFRKQRVGATKPS